MQTAEVVCREAQLEDVEQLYQLIQGYAEKGIMLPRTHEALAASIHSFIIAELENKIVGCGSLTILGKDLVEIRSLGMLEEYKGFGIGSKLVDGLIKQAKEKNMKKIMALTYAVPFFTRNGFSVVEKEIFPEKVWTDCAVCPKRFACDEIAVMKLL